MNRNSKTRTWVGYAHKDHDQGIRYTKEVI